MASEGERSASCLEREDTSGVVSVRLSADRRREKKERENDQLKLLHKITDGHSPRVVEFRDRITLIVTNRDGTRATYR